MKNFLFSAVLLFWSLASFGQVKFEKGYFVDNAGSKTEAWIKVPESDKAYYQLQYKLAEDADPIILEVETVQEYGIFDKYIFRRFDVELDTSAFEKVAQSKNPNFETKKVFLSTLIEGQANLYQYWHNNTRLFFFEVEDRGSVPQQLIFKKFYAPDNEVGINNFFRQQLLSNLRCGQNSVEEFEHIDYSKRDLVSFFKQYNDCVDVTFVNYAYMQRGKFDFNLALQGGIFFSQLSLEYSGFLARRNLVLDNIPGVRLGLEAEVILPFYRNKLAFVFEPVYQRFETERDFVIRYENFEDEPSSVSLSQQAVYLPLGLKHYFRLDDRNELFLLAEYIWTISLNSKINYAVEGYQDIEFSAGELHKGVIPFKLGVGYKYDNTYGFQLQYVLGDREVEDKYSYVNVDYDETFSLVLSYNFL